MGIVTEILAILFFFACKRHHAQNGLNDPNTAHPLFKGVSQPKVMNTRACRRRVFLFLVTVSMQNEVYLVALPCSRSF